jgi:hypothetical protein
LSTRGTLLRLIQPQNYRMLQRLPFPVASSPSDKYSVEARGDKQMVDAETRLEAIESSVRPGRPQPKPARPITIRGQEKKADEDKRTLWKENSWTPDGWESMDQATKMKELMYGRRGGLFWLNEISYKGAITLGILWVIFRIVLPALGVYQLQGDLLPASY